MLELLKKIGAYTELIGIDPEKNYKLTSQYLALLHLSSPGTFSHPATYWPVRQSP